ncbi:MAG TPA: hypothetical protein VHC69_30090 [Polyangiaceae bacterium]|nr:hypothetical protein [Polyangiaceae bacterium]
MPRTPLLGAILGLSSAAWFVTGVARGDDDAAPAASSQGHDGAPPEAPFAEGSGETTNDGSGSPAKPGEPHEAPPASVRFDAKTHFSLSWVRLPGAEDCLSAKKLSRAVETRLHRPALGAPSATDVAIEGFVEKTDDGTFHAVVTINDAHGKLMGKRELEKPECRDMDAPLALAIALMIDPDAAFSPTAAPARPRERPAVPAAAPRKPPKAPPPFGGFVSAGVAFGFGNMPQTAEGAWLAGAVVPPGLFPLELGAHLFLDQTITSGPDIKMAFGRMTLDAFACPLDLRVSVVGLGACAGVQAGTMTAAGAGQGGLIQHREALVDAAARGHIDVFFARRFALRLMPALGVPLIRDNFDYHRDDGGLTNAFRLPAVYGEASVGFGVKLP